MTHRMVKGRHGNTEVDAATGATVTVDPQRRVREEGMSQPTDAV